MRDGTVERRFPYRSFIFFVVVAAVLCMGMDSSAEEQLDSEASYVRPSLEDLEGEHTHTYASEWVFPYGPLFKCSECGIYTRTVPI